MVSAVLYGSKFLIIQLVPLGAEEAVVVVQYVGMVERAVGDGLWRASQVPFAGLIAAIAQRLKIMRDHPAPGRQSPPGGIHPHLLGIVAR
jgi:hypothetical protein